MLMDRTEAQRAFVSDICVMESDPGLAGWVPQLAATVCRGHYSPAE
jgi:hypothetical protein